ncbi:MAG TPA: efflux RND transporter periplasmic adaptor subunit [Acidobacteriaceae bacterium]|nr:efflux RND transporter periplasmic adaptor subunit [Acidobacteriaceae bacterium]
MSTKKIVIIAVLVVLVCGAIVGVTIYRGNARQVKVQTAKATMQDLSSTVSGTGQIRPLTFVNVGAMVMGRITHLYAKEGDHVKKGEIVATIESVPQTAAVASQKATINSAQKDVAADIAAEKVAEANIEHAQADLEQKRLDYKRAQELYKASLIAKQDFDSKKAAYDTDVATLAQNQAALIQARATTASARAKLSSNIASLHSDTDAVQRTVSIAPFDGIVTNEPVREGEVVVFGIQNAEGSTIMTLANMSVITAEVKVDETDIANVRLGQPADVTVDALPGQVFKGRVTEVGDQALLRSTGVATSQSTSGTEEAKDFKVVVTLDHPSDELRPGFSTTAKITTAHKNNVLAIPIQALTLRAPPSSDDKTSKKVDVSLNTAKKTPPVQGVFVVRKEGRKDRVTFVPVQTGITGSTDIEVTGGLKAGDTLVIGPYRVLRILKSDAQVKQDNTPATSPNNNSGDNSNDSANS